MGLLYPGALVFFAIVPALVLAYLARERPARVIVSSVLAFRALRGFRNERYGGKPRFDWMFLVELLLLCLAVLAMAGPFVIRKSNPIAVMIDNSAAMQVKLPSGATRFDDALKKADAMLADEDGGGKVSVFVTAPAPYRIAPAFDSMVEARHALAQIRPTDAPDDSAAITASLTDLASRRNFKKVIFASFRAIATPVPAAIHAIVTGDPAPNLALSSFTLRREVFGVDTLHARISVSNFGPNPSDIAVTLTGDGRRLARAHESLAAGETGALEFPSLAPARVYRAELTPADAFALDNVAYATSGAIRAVSILFITPAPGDAAGLGAIPGAQVTVVAPDKFAPDDLAKADVAIFEYSTPKQIPPVNTLMVMPPPDPAFGFTVAARGEYRDRSVAQYRRADRLGELPHAQSAQRRILRAASVDDRRRQRTGRRADPARRTRRASVCRDRLQSISLSRTQKSADVGADAESSELSCGTRRERGQLPHRAAVAGAGRRHQRCAAFGLPDEGDAGNAVHGGRCAGNLPTFRRRRRADSARGQP